MEKVKVTKEVAEALDLLRTNFEDNRLLYVLSSGKSERENRQTYGRPVADAIMALKNITPIETAKALINGYEVEKSPEERIVETLMNLKLTRCALTGTDAYQESCAKIDGFLLALEVAGIKLEGVNA